MIIRGNNIFRSLEEQVYKNQSDIKDLSHQVGMLGIRVVKQVDEMEDLPLETSEEFRNLEFGDAYAVGDHTAEDVSYQYVVKIADNTVQGAHWLNLGLIRGEKGARGERGEKGEDSDVPGPRGETGPAGPAGPRGETGNPGVYVGTTEPVDPEVTVWVIPNGEPDDTVTHSELNAAIATVNERIDDYAEDNIEGSDTIVFDLNEAGTKYQISIDQDILDDIDSKSTVSVSDTGTATDEIQYITIDGVEKKIAGGSGSSYTFTNGLTETDGTVSNDLGSTIVANQIDRLSSYSSITTAFPSVYSFGESMQNYLKRNIVFEIGAAFILQFFKLNEFMSNPSNTSYFSFDGNTFTYINPNAYTWFNSNNIIAKISPNVLIVFNNRASYNKYFSSFGTLYANNLSDGTTTKTMTEVLAQIPTAPTTDGNYVLKCSVVEGVATYSWEALTSAESEDF